MTVIDYILFVLSAALYLVVLSVMLVSIYIALSVFTPPPKTGINGEVDKWRDRVSEWRRAQRKEVKK